MTRLALATCLGFILRLTTSKLCKSYFIDRPEISTPLSDWRRVEEAVFLDKNGLDPYSGNIFHEYPINLLGYKILIKYFDSEIVFAAIDTITALLLGKDNRYVSYIYLLSPISIASCAGMSTATFTNFLIAASSFASTRPTLKTLTCILSAFLVCNNPQSGIIVIPILLTINSYSDAVSRRSLRSYRATIAVVIVAVIALQFISYLISGNSFSYIDHTYLYAIKYKDYKPNIGMFWYFFTEMFESFLDFFVWVVQIMTFVHALPISVALVDHPKFAFYLTLLTSVIFQPYPGIANIGLLSCLTPEWLDLMPNMSHRLKYFCAAITCMSLWPVFWHLWIVMGTANANFYFGSTLVFQLSMVLYMSDLIGSFARKYNLREGADSQMPKLN